MLVPMYLLIALWGHENRAHAAIKFFIFTQGASLLMLAAMLALVVLHQQASKANQPNVPFGAQEIFDYRDNSKALDAVVEHHTMNFLLLGSDRLLHPLVGIGILSERSPR